MTSNKSPWIVLLATFTALLPGTLYAAVAAAPSAHARLVYECKFAGAIGSQPSKSNWFYDIGWDPNCPAYYSDDQKALHIVADPRATHGRALAISVRPYPGKPGVFISGRINTHIDPAGCLKYGFFQARIKIPGGPHGVGSGAWPAFWLLGTNFPKVGWPQCGEIDIMEYSGNRPHEVTGTIHGPNGVGGGGSYHIPMDRTFWKRYHTFGCYWSPGSIRFECDGHTYATFTPLDQNRGGWVFNHPFYIILNVAQGGAYGGTTLSTARFPQTMLVDWVKVFAWKIHIPQRVAPVALGHGKVMVIWTDSAFDQTGFELQRSTSPNFVATDKIKYLPANSTDFVDQGLKPSTRYFYRIRATGGGQKSSWTLPVAVTTLSPGQKLMAGQAAAMQGPAVVSINAGGGAHGSFLADRYFNARSNTSKTPLVDMSAAPPGIPEKVFQSNRYGSMTYRIPGLKPGRRYLVQLLFSENYWSKPQQRLFAVFINNHQVLNDFDVYAAAGGKNTAIDRTFPARANKHGRIILRFASQRDNALVNGIRIFLSK